MEQTVLESANAVINCVTAALVTKAVSELRRLRKNVDHEITRQRVTNGED